MGQLIKHKDKLILLLFFLTPIAIMIRYPLTGELFVTGDNEVGLNSMSFMWRSLYNGEFPTWNKFLGNGVPIIGGPSILVLLFGWLPVEWYSFFTYCIHVSIAAFSMYLFLKEIKCNWKAALAVSILMLFSIHLGGSRRSGHSGIVFAFALFPVVMYLIQRHLNTKKLMYIALASGVVAIAFTYCHTQIVVYVATISGLYLIVQLVNNKVKIILIARAVGMYGLLFLSFAAVRLLPHLELMAEYARNGSVSDVPIDFFSSYSMTPFSLIYMIFPRFFGEEILRSDGYIPAGEMEIELFIGVAALAVALYSIRFNVRKNFQVVFFLCMCIITFAYMSVGYIPGLRELIFNLPLLGSFRCSARMIFAFLFFLYSIIAIGLTKIGDSEVEIERFVRIQYLYTGLILVSTMFIIVTAILAVGAPWHFDITLNNLRLFTQERLLNTLLVLVSVSVIFFILEREKVKKLLTEKLRYNAVLIIVTSAVLIQTIPFWVMIFPYPSADDTDSPDDKAVRTTISENIGSGKAIEAALWPDFHGSLFYHRNVTVGVSTINAYITYNNPLLNRWLSGESETRLNASQILHWIPNVEVLLASQNDLLSMLSVKYIIDTSMLINDSGSVSRSGTHIIGAEAGRIPVVQQRSFELLSSSENVQLYHGEAIHIKPQHYYLVTIDYTSAPTDGGHAYVDLYDTVGGHIDIQALSLSETYMEFVLFAEKDEILEGEQYLRLVSDGLDDPVKVTQMSLYELTFDETINYTPFLINDHVRVFENVNAQEALYLADEVRGITTTEYLFDTRYSLNLDRISYIVGAEDRLFDMRNDIVGEIDFNYTSISARITTKDGGFLNFSQNHYPGWRVYIDGIRTELELVNSLIMGVYLPPGTHEVEFRFVSESLLAGATISGTTILVCVFVFGVLPRLKKWYITKDS